MQARASGVEKNSTKQSMVLPVERSIMIWIGGPRSLVMILAWGPRKFRSASLVKSYGICSFKASKQAMRGTYIFEALTLPIFITPHSAGLLNFAFSVKGKLSSRVTS